MSVAPVFVDDGGTVLLKKHPKGYIDYDQGDWVWTGQVMGSE